MNGTLRVTPARLEKTANSFEQTGNDISKLTQQMLNLINGIGERVWSGEAAAKYKTQFAGLGDDIQTLNGMIKEHVNDLRMMAKEYASAEEASVELAQALADDIIS